MCRDDRRRLCGRDRATARSAHERGYGVVYLEDACASHSRDLHEAAIRNTENIFGTVIQSDELPTLFE